MPAAVVKGFICVGKGYTAGIRAQHLALGTYPMSSTRYVALKLTLASLEVEKLGFISRLFQKEPGRVT